MTRRLTTPRPQSLLPLLACLLAVGLLGSGAAARPRALGGAGLPASAVYLSPTGNDASPGSYAAPVATPARAQALALAQVARGKSPTIYLSGGTYRLASTLALTSLDSGETWAALPGQAPVLSGGVVVTGWTLHDAGNNIWQASSPAGLDYRQVYVNGRRAFRARSTAYNAAFGAATLGSTGYTAGSFAAFSSLGGLASVELVYDINWEQMRCPVAAANSTTVVMAQPGWGYCLNEQQGSARSPASGGNYVYVGFGGQQAPAWAENAYEFLSAATPGSFYLNRGANVLYYVPRPGESMATASVVVPQVQTLVSETGCRGVAFSGVQFSDSTWLVPDSSNGFAEVQGNLYADPRSGSTPATYDALPKMPGAVAVAGGRADTFTRCTFTRLGASGLTVDAGATNCVSLGCKFFDISGNGVGLSNPLTDTHTLAPVNGCAIRSNTVHDCAVEYQGGVGIAAWYVSGCTITRNTLYNLPYTGISVGWGHGDSTSGTLARPTPHGGNVISNNLIHDVMLSALYDGGGIYSNGYSSGETITGNVVYGLPVKAGLTQVSAYYLDDGSIHKLVSGNVAYNTGNCSYHCNDNFGGNTVSGNYFDGAAYLDGVGIEALPAPSYNAYGPNTVTTAALMPAAIIANAGVEPQYK